MPRQALKPEANLPSACCDGDSAFHVPVAFLLSSELMQVSQSYLAVAADGGFYRIHKKSQRGLRSIINTHEHATLQSRTKVDFVLNSVPSPFSTTKHGAGRRIGSRNGSLFRAGRPTEPTAAATE
jgi:hypothetical protein